MMRSGTQQHATSGCGTSLWEVAEAEEERCDRVANMRDGSLPYQLPDPWLISPSSRSRVSRLVRL
jgi:hypothetical protein